MRPIKYIVRLTNGTETEPYILDIESNEISFFDEDGFPRRKKIKNTKYGLSLMDDRFKILYEV